MVLFDNQSAVVRDSNSVARVRVCGSAAAGGCAADSLSLIPVPFLPFQPDGLCRLAGGAPLVCAAGRESVDVQFSVSGTDIPPLVARADCRPCPVGAARQEDPARGSWQCALCLPTQYVLDSNDAAYGCEDCPVGAACNGSALRGLVPGSVVLTTIFDHF